jgi:hypothetical protein
MGAYSLEGDRSGLPYTRRRGIRYEIEALTPREVWGAGNSNTNLVCRVEWEVAASWIADMVGSVAVEPILTSTGQVRALSLRRYVPEMLRYNDLGGGGDKRIQFCTMIDQTMQGGNVAEDNMAQAVTNWPEVDWCKYRATFESCPYAILDRATALGLLPSMSQIAGAAGAFAGADELYRYVTRTRRNYTKEVSVPGPNVSKNLGFFVVGSVPPAAIPGGYAFRNLTFADVTYTWVRVPVGWPPPVSYLGAWPPVFNPVAGDPTTKARTRDSFIGTVNGDYFDCAAPDGYCWAPESLLYTGYDDSRKYFDAAGAWVCDVQYFFRFKEGGWNKYLNASGDFSRVSADVVPGDGLHGTEAGRQPYATNTFDSLFQWS